MQADTIQGIAEYEELSLLRVIKRLDAEVIPRAEQLFVARIPDGERKIAEQPLHAGRAPRRIGMENQFRVRRLWPYYTLGALQSGDQVRPAVEPRVRGNPETSFEIRRLPFALRFAGGPQHRMTQPDRSIQPAFAGIRAAVGEKIHQRLQKRFLQRRTVPVINADDAAQSARLSIQPADASNLQHPHPVGLTPRIGVSPPAGFPFLNAAWLELHSTVSSFPRQRSENEIFGLSGNAHHGALGISHALCSPINAIMKLAFCRRLLHYFVPLLVFSLVPSLTRAEDQ